MYTEMNQKRIGDMTKLVSYIPTESYGVLEQDKPRSEFDEIAEQVRRVGYGILESGYTSDELNKLSEAFNITRSNYVQIHGEEYLSRANEFYTIRALLTHGDPVFLGLASNNNLMILLRKLIEGKFILNQQNGIINPSRKTYNQRAWHRDLPYQHYVATRPLAVNALFCIDDFSPDNGATFVLPATHKTVNYPSELYIQRNALQVQAKAGQYIVLDCMLFHCGGFNYTKVDRRAVNHLYTIPYFKQQIKLPALLNCELLTLDQQELFGFNFQEFSSISEYINNRII